MRKFPFLIFLGFATLLACEDPTSAESNHWEIHSYETAANGNKLKHVLLQTAATTAASINIELSPKDSFQRIIGFGGAFTESSSYLFKQLGKEKQDSLLNAFFSEDGANFSLCRTHIASCDFSLNHYTYDTVKNDLSLEHFSIKEDEADLIPFIQQAQERSKDGFRLIASPWTAPPWMKNNNSWEAGKLLPQYYSLYSKYLLKYIKAYEEKGIPIWAITPENEPLGNDSNWESMHFNPEEMHLLLQYYLGPLLKDSSQTKLLVYDQNRGKELIDWAKHLLKEDSLSNLIDGTAIHWYSSTVDPMTASIDSVHDMAPNKLIIQSEACVDNDIPAWKDDSWYWTESATDWGYEWASEEEKHLHPKYVPVFRYASDLISTLNHWCNGWVDWNMILNTKGGPNHAENWCVAPVITDEATNEIYYTPIYYTLSHFSKFIRPSAIRIGHQYEDPDLMISSFLNLDNSIALIIFNPTDQLKDYSISIGQKQIANAEIAPRALQSLLISKQEPKNNL